MNHATTIIAILTPHTADCTHVLPYLEHLGTVEARSSSVIYIDARRSIVRSRLRSKLIMTRSVIQTLLGMPVRIGAGSNKTVSLIAARSSLPGGITVIPEGTEHNFLDRTAIDLLPGIGRRTATYLRNRGIRTIGNFNQLPQYAAIKLFGISGIILHGYSGGFDPRQLIPNTRQSAISGRQSLFSLFKHVQQTGHAGV